MGAGIEISDQVYRLEVGGNVPSADHERMHASRDQPSGQSEGIHGRWGIGYVHL